MKGQHYGDEVRRHIRIFGNTADAVVARANTENKTVANRVLSAQLRAQRGGAMTVKGASPAAEKSQIAEIIFRIAAGGLTVGLLIVLPVLRILGVA